MAVFLQGIWQSKAWFPYADALISSRDCNGTKHFERVGGIGQHGEVDANGQSETESVTAVCPHRRIDAPTNATNCAGVVALPAQEKLREGAALFGRARRGE